MHNQLRGWHFCGDIEPYWHYFDEGKDVSLCGEVFLEYGEERPWFEEGIHPHPENCKTCFRLARERYSEGQLKYQKGRKHEEETRCQICGQPTPCRCNEDTL